MGLRVMISGFAWEGECAGFMFKFPLADPATLTVFFTTDLTCTDLAVVRTCVLRWPIEVTFHEVKPYLGGENSQSWGDPEPDRNVASGFLTDTLVRPG